MERGPSDERWLRRAVALARRGEGRTSPNPCVGAVIVKNGRLIGSGYHRAAGMPHAEVEALRKVRGDPRGATCYVTLEPCGHHGLTPPCSDVLIDAGIRRVVFTTRDPDPRTSGVGIRALRRAGVEVELVSIPDAEILNAPYVKWKETGLPFVIAKWAMSLDGRIASRTGDSRWISSEASRSLAHGIRDRVDAIVVGTGTVIRDDPSLTCRLRGGRTPLRVILDRRLRVPLGRKVFQTRREGPIIIIVTSRARLPRAWRARVSEMGIEVVSVKTSGNGLSLRDLLRKLGARGVQHLLVEGGESLLGSFFDEGLVDRVVVFVAPKVIGGAASPGPVGGGGIAKVADALTFKRLDWKRSGSDWVFEGDLGG